MAGWRPLGRAVGAVLVLLLSVASALHAQGTARSLDLDTSLRSSGMGGASNAVFWGDDGNVWANPALLGYHRGVLHQWTRTQLVPGLAEDVFFMTERQSAAACGVGIMQGSIDLDYGASEGTDPSGNPTGIFGSFEQASLTGIGVSASSLVRSLAGIDDETTGALARATALADVAFGYTHKHVRLSLGGIGDATDAADWGILARLSPLHRRALAGVPVDLDLAYGHSVLNATDSKLEFWFDSEPLTRGFRDGYAVHACVGLPSALHARAGLARWIAASFEPLLSASYARDDEHNQAGDDVSHGYDVTRWGVELALANVVWLRHGHVTDVMGDIVGDTTGWGLGGSFGGVIGYRYERATLPQARDSGLEDVHRRGWSAWVDPLALARMVKH